jgi:hypothetical protein
MADRPFVGGEFTKPTVWEATFDVARRMNEAHISRLEAENARLRQELEAAKSWQAAWQKGKRRRVVSGE